MRDLVFIVIIRVLSWSTALALDFLYIQTMVELKPRVERGGEGGEGEGDNILIKAYPVWRDHPTIWTAQP